MKTVVAMALRNLWQDRRRMRLPALALALVTTLLILLASLSNGARQGLLNTATTLLGGHVNVFGYYKITAGMGAPIVNDSAGVKHVVERAAPGAVSITDRIQGTAKVIAPAFSGRFMFSGIELDKEPRLKRSLKTVKGTLSHVMRPRSLVLFESQARRLEVSVGDTVTVLANTVRGAVNALDLKVVAVAQDIGNMSARIMFTSRGTLRSLMAVNKAATSMVGVYIRDARSADRVAHQIRQALGKAGYTTMEPAGGRFYSRVPELSAESWRGQRLDVNTWNNEVSQLKFIATTLEGLTWLVICMVLIVVAVGITNAMWLVVRARTREIGTLRAIGMSRLKIVGMVMAEAGSLSVGATCAGSVFGWLVASVLTALRIEVSTSFRQVLWASTLELVVLPASVVTAIVVVTGVTMLFVAWPAYFAGRVKPVVAMRAQG